MSSLHRRARSRRARTERSGRRAGPSSGRSVRVDEHARTRRDSVADERALAGRCSVTATGARRANVPPSPGVPATARADQRRARRPRRRATSEPPRPAARRDAQRRSPASSVGAPPSRGTPLERPRGSTTRRGSGRRPAREARSRARRAAARCASPALVDLGARSAARTRARSPPAATNGVTTPPIGGKLCSQTGSWTTTATTSHPRSIAAAQLSARRRLEEVGDTKTKLPIGSAPRRRPRGSRGAWSSVSGGASSAARRCPSSPRRGSHPTSRRAPEVVARTVFPRRSAAPWLAVVEVADEAALVDRADDDQLDDPLRPRAASRATGARADRAPSRVAGRRRSRRAASRGRSARAR